MVAELLVRVESIHPALVDDLRAFVADIFLGRMLGWLGDASARQLAGFSRSQIIRKKVLDTVTVVW
jgi:hypothetical protein